MTNMTEQDHSQRDLGGRARNFFLGTGALALGLLCELQVPGVSEGAKQAVEWVLAGSVLGATLGQLAHKVHTESQPPLAQS